MSAKKLMAKIAIVALTLMVTSLAVGYVEISVHNPFTGNDNVIELFK